MEDSNQTSQTQQPMNPTPSVVNSDKSKVILIILVGLIIAITAIGAYLLGTKQSETVIQNAIPPTPLPTEASAKAGIDPTANWNTYTNTKYGYIIKYPQEVTYTETSVQGIVYNKQEVTTSFKINNGSLEIAGNIGGTGYTPIKSKNIIVSGIETVKLYRTETRGVIKAIASPGGDDIYFSFILGEDPTKAEEVNILLDQILSTFKFTQTVDLSATPSPSLHTYKDAEILYSVSYPSGWKLKRTYGKDISKIAPTDVLSGIQIDNASSTNTFVLNVIDKKDTSSLVGWWNKYSPSRSINEPLTKANFSFKGQDAIKKSYTPGGNPPSRVGDAIYLLWNGYIYFFSWNYSPGTSDADLQAIANSVQLP